MTKLLKISLLPIFLSSQLAVAQVSTSINSGNPNFPFPQFLDYGNDRKTLASQNAPGVTHAEMEQRTREAWQIFSNMFEYTGQTVGGVKYIKGNKGCPYDCQEGDGYALLGAAYMADKVTFDGLWMRTHDVRMVKYPRYSDCIVPNAAYKYGQNSLIEPGGDVASDGSFDIALSLLMAWKQWGDNMGVKDACGKDISYKEEAMKVIRGLVETTNSSNFSDCRRVSGCIGFDGYVKSGNTYPELTNWANSKCPEGPEFTGPFKQYFDYMSPAYFHAFAKISEEMGEPLWNINQFKRAEASSDWLMGKLLSNSPSTIPFVGQVSLLDTTPTFYNYIFGEDFRAGWRTALNYVWHGNATSTWNPVLHSVSSNKPNTFEKDIAIRFANFIKKPQDTPWNNACDAYPSPTLTYQGASTVKSDYTFEGKSNNTFNLNWIHGAGSPSAVASQDFELMSTMFRQCAISWDVTSAGDKNLTSVPRYFDGWFRMLGMLVLTGNAHTPLKIIPQANLKVYHKVDKTVANLGEQVTYTVSYRNFGSKDATWTIVRLGIPTGLQFVSANKGGILSGDSVIWNIGTVKGFRTGMLAATMDSVKVTFSVKNSANGRLCTNANILCTNGLGWKSNEYPNNKTTVMERNCVDISKRGLKIEKSATWKTYGLVKDTTEITYKIKFENASDTGWINGGRPGVRLSFAHDLLTTPSATSANTFKFRLFHDAAEPYIDYGNYRVSYFISDKNIKCYSGIVGGSNLCWNTMNTIHEGGGGQNLDKTTYETYNDGSDANGNWNQRIVLQFAPYVATVSQHLQQYQGMPNLIHEGGTEMLRNTTRLYPSNYSNVNWTDDWSWDATMSDSDAGLYFPIGDDFTLSKSGATINTWHKSACQMSTKTMKKVLVEEWDGYTWRRVYGNAPKMARPIANVVIRDTLPAGVTFRNFVNQSPAGVSANTVPIAGGKTIIIWSIPNYSSSLKDSISYKVIVDTKCGSPNSTLETTAWISGNDVPSSSSKNLVDFNCTVTGSTEKELFNSKVIISPNPARETIHVAGPEYETADVIIRDLKGAIYYRQSIQLNSDLDISLLPNGAYTIEITSNGFVKQNKLLVLK